MPHNLIATDRGGNVSLPTNRGEDRRNPAANDRQDIRQGRLRSPKLRRLSGLCAKNIFPFHGRLSSTTCNQVPMSWKLQTTSFVPRPHSHREKSLTGVIGPMKLLFVISQFTMNGSDCNSGDEGHRSLWAGAIRGGANSLRNRKSSQV